MKFILNLFWFFLFLPFVSPFPIHTDVQPICGALGLFLILKHRHLDKITLLGVLCLLVGFIFSIIYYLNNPSINPFGPLFRKGLALLIGFITYQAVLISRHSLSINILFVASSIYSLFAGLFLVNPFLALKLQNAFVRTTTVDLDNLFSYRGASILAAEPSFTSCAIFVILLITLFCRYNSSIYFKFKRNFIVVSSIISILATKSGSGYLLLFSLFVYTIFVHRSHFSAILNLKVNKILAISAIFALLFTPVFYGRVMFDPASNRGLQVLFAVIHDSQALSLLTRSEASIGLRINLFLEQLQVIAINPFLGHGFQGSACFQAVSSSCENKSIISTFLYYTISIGILFPVTILFLFRRSLQSYYIKFISFGFLLFSLSYAFPGPWTLLALQPKSKP